MPSLPIKRLFRVVNGSTPASGDAECWDGEVAWVTPEDLGKLDGREVEATRRTLTQHGYATCGTTLVPPGSLVLSTRAPIGHVAIAGRELCTNQGCKALRPLKPLDSLYFYFALLASKHRLQALGQGTTFQELGSDALGAFEIPAPNLDHQRAIASFLDRKTSAIDALIAKKERLIELLQEKRQALITQAVTKGLDPSVPMKESGLGWMGSIPTHWAIKRLKHLTRQVTVGIVITPSKYYVEEGVPCPRSFNVKPGRVDTTDLAFISPESNRLLSKSIIREGDLVAVRTGQPGTTAVVPRWLDGGNCIDLIIVRRSPNFSSAYLCHFMNSALAQHQYGAGSEGALQQHFNVETASNLLVPTPPVDEQAKIAARLTAALEQADRLLAAVQAHIEKLREYRQALITAAVTGKIDVSTEAA